MSDTATAPTLSRPLLLLAAVGGVLLTGTVALWAHYGTAVFEGTYTVAATRSRASWLSATTNVHGWALL